MKLPILFNLSSMLSGMAIILKLLTLEVGSSGVPVPEIILRIQFNLFKHWGSNFLLIWMNKECGFRRVVFLPVLGIWKTRNNRGKDCERLGSFWDDPSGIWIWKRYEYAVYFSSQHIKQLVCGVITKQPIEAGFSEDIFVSHLAYSVR